MIFETKKPGVKIKSVLADLGSEYEIKRIDLWNNIYRDLGNGYEIQIGEIDNADRIFNVSVSIWMNKPTVKPIESVANIKSVQELKSVLDEMIVKYS
ncbi:hypothetical protein R0K30_14575 [Bacillus sp. SIMBA_154]|uniref:hypothetical protein n=1 Tax=Bacillus sp. SIMBA_154 TaxID=3080859 RepID=UPI00397D8C13